MNHLTIADRRAVTLAIGEHEVQALKRDPKAVVSRITGHDLNGDTVRLVEERADAWEFVIPATTIEAVLPEPVDARSVIENDVYAVLRDEPAVRPSVVSDPVAFLKQRFGLDFGSDTRINVREEAAGEILLVLPFGDARDELPDDALDLVAGGTDTVTGGGANPVCVIGADGVSRQVK